MVKESQHQREYVRMFERVSRHWSPWEQFSQIRRPSEVEYEIRRSTPACMLVGVIAVLVSIEVGWFGGIFRYRDLTVGVVIFFSAIVIFLIGSGMIIDGKRQRITTWWGWIYRPLFKKTYSFSDVETITIAKKTGPTSPDKTIGVDVTRPVYLVMRSGKRLLALNCLWAKGARLFAEQISKIMTIPYVDKFPEDEDNTY